MNELRQPVLVQHQLYHSMPTDQPQQPMGERNDDSINVARYISILARNRWLILGVALSMALLGVAYSLIAKPKYEANILVQIDESFAPPKNILTDFTNTSTERKGGIATEMEVIRSRNVLSQVVEKTRSYIDVQPKYFPVIGPWIARFNANVLGFGPANFSNLSGYVWGVEQASISILNVPQKFEGEKFILTAENGDGYRVRLPAQDIDFKAKIGEAVKVPTKHGDIELRVDRIEANPGAEFLVTRSANLAAIEKLEKSLKITEKGKQSGIINVMLRGTEPVEISNVLNEIGREYIQKTLDHKAEEAERSLVFLNKQLPVLKQELENAEAKYNQVRKTHSTIDLGDESKAIVQQAVSLQTKVIELRQRKQDLLSRFVDTHPSIELVNEQLAALGKELNIINEKTKRVPSVEQEVLRATRDVKVNTELYTNLLSTAQQLRQISASRLGGFRLLDTAAVPVTPIGPAPSVVISFATLIGLIFGLIAALAKNKLKGEVIDPYMLESSLGVPVTATIPHSPRQKNLYSQIQNKAKKVSVLPYATPADSAVEGLRGFRTVLQSAIDGFRNNIILITGPAPEVGKSFVSANIANVLASIGKRVLLIDGDMRTGYLHRYFGLERKNGLSEIITAKIGIEDAIHKEVVENVDFISTGILPDTPSELLAHQNFKMLLHSLSSEYDFILIDTAPVLAFSDAMIVAAEAGAIYNVVRAGVSTVSEIEETVRCLTQAGGKVTGTILNDMKGRSVYRYGYGSRYRKSYYSDNEQ